MLGLPVTGVEAACCVSQDPSLQCVHLRRFLTLASDNGACMGVWTGRRTWTTRTLPRTAPRQRSTSGCSVCPGSEWMLLAVCVCVQIHFCSVCTCVASSHNGFADNGAFCGGVSVGRTLSTKNPKTLDSTMPCTRELMKNGGFESNMITWIQFRELPMESYLFRFWNVFRLPARLLHLQRTCKRAGVVSGDR